MKKLSQLQLFHSLGLPTLPFLSIIPAQYQHNDDLLWDMEMKLQFPLAVLPNDVSNEADSAEYPNKSSVFSIHKPDVDVDGDASYCYSPSAHLNTSPKQLAAVIAAFQAIHNNTQEAELELILQEMPKEVLLEGQLIANTKGIFQLNYQVLSEQDQQEVQMEMEMEMEAGSINLPKFEERDLKYLSANKHWLPFGNKQHPYHSFCKAFKQLSVYAQRINLALAKDHPFGTKINFVLTADAKNPILLLGCEKLHGQAQLCLAPLFMRELFPSSISPFTASVLNQPQANEMDLFTPLHPDLSATALIKQHDNWPYLNIGALLDVLVKWGLPSRPICKILNISDPYNLGFRPLVAASNIKAIYKAFDRQSNTSTEINRWLFYIEQASKLRRTNRKKMWFKQPKAACENLLKDLSEFYTQLYQRELSLTISLAIQLGISIRSGLPTPSRASSRTGFLQDVRSLFQGNLPLDLFLLQHGHRGMYEGDLAELRFEEIPEEAWGRILHKIGPSSQLANLPLRKPLWKKISFNNNKALEKLFLSREQLHHESMLILRSFRKELKYHTQYKFGADFDFSAFTHQELIQKYVPKQQQRGTASSTMKASASAIAQQTNTLTENIPTDTFITNGTSWEHWQKLVPFNSQRSALKIETGYIEGQIWRLSTADIKHLKSPIELQNPILVVDELSPAWAAWLSFCNGFVALKGNPYSNAALLLKDAGIPSMIANNNNDQFKSLRTGDWVRLDTRNAKLEKLMPVVVHSHTTGGMLSMS